MTIAIDNMNCSIHQPPTATHFLGLPTCGQNQHGRSTSIVSMRTIGAMASIHLPSYHIFVDVHPFSFLLLPRLNPFRISRDHRRCTRPIFGLLTLKSATGSASLSDKSQRQPGDIGLLNNKDPSTSASKGTVFEIRTPWGGLATPIDRTIPQANHHDRIRNHPLDAPLRQATIATAIDRHPTLLLALISHLGMGRETSVHLPTARRR